MVDKLCVVNHQEDDTLSSNESGSVHTNMYAEEDITLYLPSVSGNEGVYYYFAAVASTFVPDFVVELRIKPQAGDIIWDNSHPAQGKYVAFDSAGEMVKLVSDGDDTWFVANKYGIFIVET